MAMGLSFEQQQALDDMFTVGLMTVGQALFEAERNATALLGGVGTESLRESPSASDDTSCPHDCICDVYPGCSDR